MGLSQIVHGHLDKSETFLFSLFERKMYRSEKSSISQGLVFRF
jgi:hypothetical protein